MYRRIQPNLLLYLLKDEYHRPTINLKFFYTFNALLDESKQIILTSDRYPKELTELDPRLVYFEVNQRRYFRLFSIEFRYEFQYLAVQRLQKVPKFNALLDESKQIILTSDRYPKELTELDPRLVSRFSWGLSVGVQ
jgi:uncharacterized protein (DUF2249 family)